ncbi:LacI family DNA-binding transcriptional regulator [Actinospica sp. MGRD01-02]|uniref:LacI family DNA-binding transcriptional regulator n=1 Tax=Actinospica acidithermotolerans TaxID=2828514 RepID=A0A941E925_9ACTN|nr:LacI family DNA-binding transcriptional regulator [Actinospica acidithermotolerans]MBR7827236.1 LacI family DNA-binding transcriptional regulator [Actinospica acidithermotolerans]
MNIGEIAKRAGVSRSTVSYALSGKRHVSPETKARIQQVIDELDYRPNAAARALKEGRTRTIGLVIPPPVRRLTYMQLEFVASVLEAASQADLDVLLSPSGDTHAPAFSRLIDGRRVDGVILMEIRLQDPRVDQLRKAGMPFVTIGHTAHPEGVWWVDVDYQGLVGRCVKHLADLGHRDVALINRSAEMLADGYGPGLRAQQGFAQAVAQYGLTGFEYPCADDAPAGDACVERILNEHPEVTAAVTVNESALPGFQRALQRAGLRVPADFSLIGVAAQHWAEEFQPPLTSADVPAVQMGAEAVQLLTEYIADRAAAPKHLLLSPPISLRDSVSRARTLERD